MRICGSRDSPLALLGLFWLTINVVNVPGAVLADCGCFLTVPTESEGVDARLVPCQVHSFFSLRKVKLKLKNRKASSVGASAVEIFEKFALS